MRKLLFATPVVVLCLILLFGSVSLAKGKGKGNGEKHGPPPKGSYQGTLDHGLISAYGVDSGSVLSLREMGFDDEEISLVLFMYGNSGASVTRADLTWIKKSEDNWVKLSWYLGQPPVVFPDGPIQWRRPVHPRILPPLGVGTYQEEKNGPIREKLHVRSNAYEYQYEDKRSKVEEKITSTPDKYEYKYEDRNCEEKLTVDLRTYRYSYRYENKRTGAEVKDEGIAMPFQRQKMSRLIIEEVAKPTPTFSFKVNLNFNIDL